MTERSETFSVHVPLSRSWKGAYPFRLGTTSFIYPDHYIPNVRMLAPSVDEIELLMFESRWPDSLPSKETIDALCKLSADMDVGYNIHLPSDVSPASVDPVERSRAASVISAFIRATAPLEPSAWALHLPFEGIPADTADIKRWRIGAAEGIGALLEKGIPSRQLAVETLDYPLAWVVPVIEAFDLSICMDIGHMILYGYDFESFFFRYRDRISLIHLHGVQPPEEKNLPIRGRDHVGLDEMASEHFPPIMKILQAFDGVVSLEVFSHRHLVSSLKVLELYWQDCRKDKNR